MSQAALPNCQPNPQKQKSTKLVTCEFFLHFNLLKTFKFMFPWQKLSGHFITLAPSGKTGDESHFLTKKPKLCHKYKFSVVGLTRGTVSAVVSVFSSLVSFIRTHDRRPRWGGLLEHMHCSTKAHIGENVRPPSYVSSLIFYDGPFLAFEVRPRQPLSIPSDQNGHRIRWEW